MNTYTVVSPLGSRDWRAEDDGHACEQHIDAFPDEPIINVTKKAGMKTTVRQQTDERFDADTIHITKDDQHGDAPEMRVYVYPDDVDGVPVVQIDTDKGFGEFRIAVNDQHYVIHDEIDHDQCGHVNHTTLDASRHEEIHTALFDLIRKWSSAGNRVGTTNEGRTYRAVVADLVEMMTPFEVEQ